MPQRRAPEPTALPLREELAGFVHHEEVREQRREYIHGHRSEPDEPQGIDPLVFQGLTDAGSIVQIRGKADEYQVWVDGSLQDRIATRKDLSVDTASLHFRWDGKELVEIFNASDEALRALADYRDDPAASLPSEYASELLADGLIDVHFDLTPRGRRALAPV